MKKMGVIGVVAVIALLGFMGIRSCSLFQESEPELTNWEPDLSPDGKTIAFASPGEKGFQIYARQPYSGEETQLTSNEGNNWAPSWSPQGDQIVFCSDLDQNVDLYVINVNTLQTVRLTTHEDDDVNPMWTSENTILFNSNRSGVWEIYAISPYGDSLIKVTETSTEE
ncbi:PD40 domain-containing protein [Candidatus Bipolaricaulota bacterium]|nr:PD40 domain-containing protein [Candidatus Bipolaricaulota bacterium]